MKNAFTTKEWIIITGALLFASFAICVGLGYIAIGHGGIVLTF